MKTDRAPHRVLPGEQLTVLTSVGPLRGTWRGGMVVEAGCVVDVELDLPGEFPWSAIHVSDAGPPFEAHGSPTLSGEVLDVDAYGVLTLDVGGAILMVETSGRAPDGVVGARVSVPAASLGLYPSGL